MKRFFYTSLSAIALLAIASPVQAENLVQLQSLLSTRACEGCDLSRAGLVYTDLVGVNLRGANLSQANFSQSNLSNANLSNANLAGAVFFQANLAGADLSGADLRGADLRSAYLVGANLDGAQMEGINFLGAVGIPDTIATPEVLHQWGLLESEQGNYELAIDYFTRSLELKPDEPQVHLGRSIARFRWGDPEGAYLDAKRAEQLFMDAGDTAGQQTALTLAEGIEEVQRRLAEGPEPPPPNFFNFLSSVATLLLRLAL